MQVRMSLETNAEKIKDLALMPVCSRPHGDDGGDGRVFPGDPHAQAQYLAQRKRKQVVIHFETRFHREAAYRAAIREEIELQLRFRSQVYGGALKLFPGHYNG